MQERCSQGSVGERGGNDPRYPEKSKGYQEAPLEPNIRTANSINTRLRWSRGRSRSQLQRSCVFIAKKIREQREAVSKVKKQDSKPNNIL